MIDLEPPTGRRRSIVPYFIAAMLWATFTGLLIGFDPMAIVVHEAAP